MWGIYSSIRRRVLLLLAATLVIERAGFGGTLVGVAATAGDGASVP